MALPDDLQPVQTTRGDFLYKIGDEAEWTRLPSPIDNLKHNCYGIRFDHGIIITQKYPEHGSICRVKLILKPPAMETEEDLPIIRAECVEIHNPSFSAHPGCRDKAKAVEYAKTLPLASLDRTITAVKLRNLSTIAPYGKTLVYDHELQERVWELIERGYRATRAAQTNGVERKLWTPPPRQPSSSSEVVVDKDKPRVQLPTPQAATPPQPPNNSSGIPADKDKTGVQSPTPQAAAPPQRPNSPPDNFVDKDKPRVQSPTPQAATVPQQPSSSSSKISTDDKDKRREQSPTRQSATAPHQQSSSSSEISVDKDKLSERLQVHQAATAEGEQKIRQGLEGERKAVLRAVTVAINGEWDKRVAAAVTEYRAQAASTVERILAEGEGLGWGWR